MLAPRLRGAGVRRRLALQSRRLAARYESSDTSGSTEDQLGTSDVYLFSKTIPMEENNRDATYVNIWLLKCGDFVFSVSRAPAGGHRSRVRVPHGERGCG